MIADKDSIVGFPKGLLNWAGHREGGVKKPFHSGSGRPTGSAIDTPVVKRLRAWGDALVEGRPHVPTAMLLVGGPGNGKTDAVEVAIQHLDERLGLQGALLGRFTSAYTPPAGQLAPRLTEVDLQSIASSLPPGFPPRIRLVQDATERDAHSQQSAASLLIDELRNVIASPGDAIYICCANRGIISEAAGMAKQSGAQESALTLLNNILAAVTSGPKDLSCWPLADFPRFAVWPMDVESLTEVADAGQETVAHQVFHVALDVSRWPSDCAAGAKCPFCKNRELLSDGDALNALVRLLRFYELGSGKRWTFRDLFSLVAHLLVGTEQEYIERDALLDPCQWAAKQTEIATRTSEPSRVFRSKLELMARLYPHRLFPLWPPLRSGEFYKAQREMARFAARELDPVKTLLSWFGGRHRVVSTDLVGALIGPWSSLLDPALATGSCELFKKGKSSISVQDVEERFGLSVADGLDLVKSRLTAIEVDVLKDLAKSDEYLGGDDLPRSFSSHARLMQSTLRQVCCRIAKRSIGVRNGICKGWDHLTSYHQAITAEDGLKEFRKQLQAILHDDKNRFRSSLATTFGQPVPYRSRNVMLITAKVPVKNVPRSSSVARPVESVPYVRVNNHVIPVTFELFSALREVGGGMRPSSLGGEIFALLDATHSIVTGQVVRSPAVLEEEVLIEIGGCREHLVLEDGKLSVETGKD